ncbi:MAG: dTDP-4-dehydrorhamnose 3,5-epimerase [Ardenticatenaceae bacterium]|nr:dTDP-4-dehydrorhamnose 3,5-epimerase [Ardenticatenaceae bacterium]
MIFEETRLPGAYIIHLEPIQDNRGFFSRVFCQREFEAHNLHTDFVQANLTHSEKKGTLRGLHYQIRPHKEVKLVHCPRGAIYDVIVDMRPDSPTYLEWISVELTAENRKMIYIPGDFAHGYQTLADDSEVYYQVGQFYAPDFEQGIQWDDPALNIKWPDPSNPILSEKDKMWPEFQPEKSLNYSAEQIHRP